jgi:hypothetical protein
VDFDGEIWRAQQGSALEGENPRSAMLPALQREHLVPGAARDEVRRLLGPPQFEIDDRDVYALGRSPYGVSDEQLAIAYDEDEKLVRAVLRRT